MKKTENKKMQQPLHATTCLLYINNFIRQHLTGKISEL